MSSVYDADLRIALARHGLDMERTSLRRGTLEVCASQKRGLVRYHDSVRVMVGDHKREDIVAQAALRLATKMEKRSWF